MDQEKNTVSTPEVEVEKTMNEGEEFGLVVSNTINSGLLTGKENSMKRFTNLDLGNDEEAELLLSAVQDCDHYLKDEIGKEIKVIAHIVNEFPRTRVDEETGEAIDYLDHSLILIDDKGESHVTGSSNAYNNYNMIISLLKRTPSKENPINILVGNRPDKNDPTHTYLTLKFKKEVK